MNSDLMKLEGEETEEMSDDEQDQVVSVEKMGQFGSFIQDIKFELDHEMQSESMQSGGRRPKKLKSAVAGLMGEANIKYASGNINEAIKMSMEVIRNAPDSPDPFQLLAIIYEESEQMEKSLQYGLVAAFLTKNSIDEWMAVANKSVNLNNFKLAHMCYEKICKLDANNEKFWHTKCDLMKKAGCDNKKILESYCQILNIVREQDGNRYMNMARGLFMEYISLEDTAKAREIMMKALECHATLVTKSDINLLIEALFMENCYKASLDVLSNHCGVRIYEVIINNEPKHKISLESDLPVDLLAKLLICIINLEMVFLVDPVLEKLVKEDCDVVGDLYMDVAEAFMKKDNFERAENIYKILVNSTNYNLPAVLLKYGESVKLQFKFTEAITIYSRVVELAPDHVEARISLSRLYQQLGCHDQSLMILNSTVNLDNITEYDLKMLIGYCFLLERQGRVKEYIKLSMKVLKVCCNQVLVDKNKAEVSTNRILRLRNYVYHHAVNNIFKKSDIPQKTINLLPLSNEIWDLFTKISNTLWGLKKFEKFEILSLLMVMCPAYFQDLTKSYELEFICMISGILNKSASFPYYIARSHIMKGLNNNRIWNLLSRIIAVSQDAKHNRFCIRLAMKRPNNLALCQLNGHNAFIAGSYKHALGEYFMCIKLQPHNPLHYLMIALCYNHLVCQKFSSHRNILSVQAHSFLNHYRVLRGPHQETFYNIGRAMHQVGLITFAVSYYEKVLTDFPDEPDALFSLKREAAFNLHLIYSKTSPELARIIMYKYLVV